MRFVSTLSSILVFLIGMCRFRSGWTLQSRVFRARSRIQVVHVPFPASSWNRHSQAVKMSSRLPLRLYSTVDATSLTTDIKSKGDEIRQLKDSKAEKTIINAAVKQLLDLKAKYLELTGTPYDAPKVEKKAKSEAIEKESTSSTSSSSAVTAATTLESLVITPRNVDYSSWYSDVITAADMVDTSPVRGCMVIKPWGMGIWDLLRAEFDIRIRDTGAQNAYFPLFIPKSFLAKEAEHVEGFAKECAVVTHHRLCRSPDGKDLIPDPEALLEEPLIVRPTSETVIWNMFGKWISSYRDLPLKLNQWANVVRWEMRTRPFLRSSEFLWQEGHTAHATADDAIATAQEMLDVYASVCQDMLSLPVIKGRKSPSERFAGADDTYTIEALMQNGWALQSGTSHFLGQNFARAFDVTYQTVTGSRELVWATSWGVSTRLIGALVMTHSDDKGLVLPPKVAPIQVVIVPIIKGSGEETDRVLARSNELAKILRGKGIRVKIDDRENLRPGAKYFEWERKGLPLRIDIGPRDIASNSAVLSFRYNGQKISISTDIHTFEQTIQDSLDQIQLNLYKIAEARLKAKTLKVNSYDEMKKLIENAANGDLESAGFYLVPWKCDATNEEVIKQDCKATIRCYPIDLNKSPPDSSVKCFYSGDSATHYALFARAF